MPELATYALFAYRQEAFVAAALRGVARQTYRPLEVVVVDDGSHDGTAERAEVAGADLVVDDLSDVAGILRWLEA